MIEHSTRDPLAAFDGVTMSFGVSGSKVAVIRQISLEAFPGELLVLLGPSGSGKTTLLTLMAGLLPPTEGSVSLFGNPIQNHNLNELQHLRATRIGFVFQTFLLIDALTVLENVLLVLRFAGCPAKNARERARQVLARLHIGHLGARFPGTLSQGEKQRVGVARAIANSAELLLADEPTASLESAQGLEIIRLLYAYAHDRKAAVVVATHDLRIVEYADRVLKIEDGRLLEG